MMLVGRERRFFVTRSGDTRERLPLAGVSGDGNVCP
jgi:hypothetical protein